MAYTAEEVVLLFHRRRLRITITTAINAIWNIYEWPNVECGMSAGCNSISDWRSSAKTVAFFGLKINHSMTDIRASFLPQMED